MSVAAEKLPAGATTFKVAQPTRHLDAIKPHPDNPRDEISQDDPKIQEMAASIIRFGIIEPLVINKDGVLYAGHRRRVASRVAYKKTKDAKFLVVPVTYNDSPPEAALELMLQENMQRESLNPLEEARALYAIKERRRLTTADLVRHLELPAPTVSQSLAILKCEPEVQALYRENELPRGAAPLLARVGVRDKQLSYAGLLARRQITLAEFKKQVAKDLDPQPPDSAPSAGEPPFVPDPKRLAAVPKVQPGGGGKKVTGGPEPGHHLAPTRAEAVASLSKVLSRRISLVSFRSILETVCCSCGMSGQEEVCRSCPLPRVIQAVVGRAEV